MIVIVTVEKFSWQETLKKTEILFIKYEWIIDLLNTYNMISSIEKKKEHIFGLFFFLYTE